MAIYKYRAKKGIHEMVEGCLEAQSEKEAIEKLSVMGYLPTRIEEEGRAAQPAILPLKKSRGRIKSRQITILSRQLASLLKAGVPLLACLNILSEQSDSISLKGVLCDISRAVKDGSTFSSTLAQYPEVFSSLYVALVRTGEDSGSLPGALLRIADYRSKQEEILSRLRMALAYPALMAIVGVGTIVFMLAFVMPRLMKIFVNLGEQLPLPTRILIFISQGLRMSWPWIVLGIVGIIFVIRQQLKNETLRLSLSHFQLHLPLLGTFVSKTELCRFSRTLELLIRNGLPILKAIDLAIPVLNNEVIKGKLRQSYKDLEQGGSFGKSLKNSTLFPVFMSNLVAIGEESGKLADALAEVANSYEQDTDETIKIISNLLEPFMILGMGLVIGFMVVAMLLPIFEINILAK